MLTILIVGGVVLLFVLALAAGLSNSQALKSRVILFLGGLAGVIAALLGYAVAAGWLDLTAATITGIGGAVGGIATLAVMWVRSTRDEIVFVVLAGVASAVGLTITLLDLAGLDVMSAEAAGKLQTAIVVVTAFVAIVLRGEVTSPVNVDKLEGELAEARGD